MNLSLLERVRQKREGRGDVPLLAMARVSARLDAIDAAAAVLEAPGAVVTPLAARDAGRLAYEAWTEHVALREALLATSVPLETAAGGHGRTLLRLSWTAVARAALLARQARDAVASSGAFDPWPECFTRRATDYAYVRDVDVRRQVSLGPACLGTYSARLVVWAARALGEALDTYGWTESAGDYLEALFLRYAAYLHAAADAQTADAAYEDDGGELVASPGDAASPLIPGGRLTSAYLDEGERFFFHHLWRSRALVALVRDSRPLPERPDRAWLCAALRATLAHSILRDTAVERVQAQFLDMFVWPEERETLQATYPQEADTSATMILYRLRLDVLPRLQALQRTSTLAHLEAWRCSSAEAGSVRDLALERIVLLALAVCLDLSLAGTGTPEDRRFPLARHGYLDQRALAPPFDLPPPTPAAARAVQPGSHPLFVAVWGVYAVITGGGNAAAVYTTRRLEAAVHAWLHAAVASGLIDAEAAMRAGWALDGDGTNRRAAPS